MRVLVYGNNKAATGLLNLLQENIPKDNILVVAPYSEQIYTGQESAHQYVNEMTLSVIQDPLDGALNKELLSNIKNFAPDVLFSVYCGQHIAPEILAIPKLYAIDFHASLLPKYRGFAPLIWAIAEGEKKTGISVCLLNHPKNKGDIICQKEIKISEDDTGYDLHEKAAEAVNDIFPRIWDMLQKGTLKARPQKSLGSFYGRDSKRINQINWRDSAEHIYNVIRALAPPLLGAYTYYKNKKCLITGSRIINDDADHSKKKPGDIFVDNKGLLMVATGEGVLELLEIQIDSKQLTARSFAENYVPKKGNVRFRYISDEPKDKQNVIAMEGGKKVSKRFIFFGMPSFDSKEEEAVVDTLRSKWIGMGSKTLLFEKKISEYVKSKWAFSVNSCTAALHLSLIVSGIKEGDEVITTPLTFIATVNAIEYVGAKPVFADIQADTLNIDPQQILSKITSKTKAILPVHFGGLPVDMDAIENIAEQNNLNIIYDCAHALGAIHKNKKIGSGKYFSCFSFYPNKNITSCEGGMITGQNPEKLNDLMEYRQHGLHNNAWKRFHTKKIVLSDVTKVGFKYNMPDLNAAIGLVQLSKIEKFLKARKKIADYYNKELKSTDGITCCYTPEQYVQLRHALHLYVVLLDLKRFRVDRNQMVAALREENIGAAIHYLPIHRYCYYREKYNLSPHDYPIADSVGLSCLTLPIHPNMTTRDASIVIKALRKVLNWYKMP